MKKNAILVIVDVVIRIALGSQLPKSITAGYVVVKELQKIDKQPNSIFKKYNKSEKILV